jgi:4-diphosphocytidyl-2-C-methyl-D-erythritol kinase
MGLGAGFAVRPPPLPDDGFIAALGARTNALEAPACALNPAIGETLAALQDIAPGALARMSGSGACCFAVLGTAQAAVDAAQRLRAAQPTWWIAATHLQGAQRQGGS